MVNNANKFQHVVAFITGTRTFFPPSVMPIMSNRVQQRQPSPQNQQSIVLESQRSHSLNQMITLPQKRKEHVREKKNPITAGRE
jgi:hypothetical protein